MDDTIQPRVTIDAATVAEYAEAMAAGAEFPPVVVFDDGSVRWLADGFHRVKAAERIGVTELPADVKRGTRRDALLFAISANQTHGLRRTNADKRRVVQTVLGDDEWARWSDHEIARRCGVSQPFVSDQRSSLITVISEPAVTQRTYTTKHGTVATMETAAIGKSHLGVTDVRGVVEGELRRCPTCGQLWAVDLELCPYCTIAPVARQQYVSKQQAETSKLDIHFSSDTAEHYTPPVILDAVTACLGAIDLDPCSNTGSPNVAAAKYYMRADDGLLQTWVGTVYMNPPYGREIDQWVTKLVDEYRTGRVTEAIALLPARTDTQWFQRLRDYACCFVEGRLTFIGNDDPAPFPSAIFYLGDDLGKFYHHFCEIGDVWQRIEPGVSFGE